MRGHEVTVECGNKPLPAGTYQVDGIRIVRHQILSRLYGTPIMPTLLGKLARSDADILHGNFPSPYIAFLVAATSKINRIPAVLTWHNDLPPVTSGARLLIETHDRLMLPRYITLYRRVISTSAYYAERSRNLTSFGNILRVVSNGVDCDTFNPSTDGSRVREQLHLGNRFTLIFVGALTKWHRYKGLEILLRAVNELVAGRLDLALVVVGDGELKEYYVTLSRQLSLDKVVMFVGNVPDAELPQYYAASDALVLPSKDMSEGFGLTLLEANASGKPVIASRVGGIPDVVRDGYNGILVPPNDPNALAAGIRGLMMNPENARLMGRNGRKHAEAHDWKKVGALTEQVYEEALA